MANLGEIARRLFLQKAGIVAPEARVRYGTIPIMQADRPIGPAALEMLHDLRAEVAPTNCVRLHIPDTQLSGGGCVGLHKLTPSYEPDYGSKPFVFMVATCGHPVQNAVVREAKTQGLECSADCVLNAYGGGKGTGILLYDAKEVTHFLKAQDGSKP